MATLEVNGQVVGYATEGEGTPLLLLHGTTQNRAGWDMVRAAMPAGTSYTFVMVEFPGSGESAMPSEPLSVEALADQAAAVMAHLGHERYHVAGYSLGAVVAAGVAARHSGNVASATLLCGWVATDARMRITFDLWQKLIAVSPELFMHYALADGFTAEGLAMIEPMVPMMLGMAADAVAPGSHAHLELDKVVDISAMLPAITAPTLVISGEQDRWVDVRHGRALADGIAGARFEALPAGHVVIQEMAADIAALVAAHTAAA